MAAEFCVDSLSNPRPDPKAIEAMLPWYGNPFCPHDLGQRLLPHIEKAEKALYDLVEAPSDTTFVFTSGQSESINQVLSSVTLAKKGPIVSFAHDIAPIIFPLSHLEKEGHRVTLVDKMDSIEQALTDETALLSISSSQPLLGLLHPIRECARACRARNILFHVDVSYSLARDMMLWNDIGADYLTFGGEHIFAPLGTGALFAKKGVPLSPLIFGEGEEELHRGGAFNVPLFIAFGKAAEITALARTGFILEQTRLRDLFEKKLTHAIPDVEILFRDAKRLPHVSVLAFPKIRNELLLFMLNERGVFASMGGGTFQPIEEQLASHPLAQNALTFSLPREIEDIDVLVQTIGDTVESLRPLSEGL